MVRLPHGDTANPPRYRGRFAPSPTGPLHFGSLVTALGSFLQARRQGGEWLVRMEDLDPPREMPGAAAAILRTLEAYHLEWDGPVLYQSQRHAAYAEAVAALAREAHTFACACSRKSIALALKRTGKPVYPGTCRAGLVADSRHTAVRVRVPPLTLRYSDLLQGAQACALGDEVGDFVIRRADGLYAYHLAVVVDDAFQGITDIVRGADLLEATPPQRFLQQLLDLPTPRYAHLPVAVNAQGEKLSKQTHAAPLNPQHPAPALLRALRFLGHAPDAAVDRANPRELLDWALAHWDLGRVPSTAAIPVSEPS